MMFFRRKRQVIPFDVHEATPPSGYMEAFINSHFPFLRDVRLKGQELVKLRQEDVESAAFTMRHILALENMRMSHQQKTLEREVTNLKHALAVPLRLGKQSGQGDKATSPGAWLGKITDWWRSRR